MGAGGKNNPGSCFVIGRCFATEIGSNFIIGVRNTTDHEPPQSIRDAFSLWFVGQRSFVTIHLIGWFDFKTLQESWKQKVNYENVYGKYDGEVSICVKKHMQLHF